MYAADAVYNFNAVGCGIINFMLTIYTRSIKIWTLKAKPKEGLNNLANIKSAKKRINTTLKKTMRNKIVRSRSKTAVKKFVAATAGGDANAIKTALSAATSSIDKAVSKGVYHKNTAARKKSRLSRLANKAAV